MHINLEECETMKKNLLSIIILALLVVNIILSAIQASTSNYENLLGSLGQYRDLIHSNRQALHPAEEEFEDLSLDDAGNSGPNVIQ